MKKEKNIARLMKFAGKRKILIVLSWILSASSAVFSLMPIWYIWLATKEVICDDAWRSDPYRLKQYAIFAFGYAVCGILLYVIALLCSHLSAFKVASNIRIFLSEHIMKIGIGKLESFGSGVVRRTLIDTSGAMETYLAHQLPDQAKAYGTILTLVIMIFKVDYRFGLFCLISVVFTFLSMSAMMGKELQSDMAEFQTALGNMSNEAVEYIRGMPVIKTFGQTIHSFTRFKNTIDQYGRWAIAFTTKMRKGMILFTIASNSIFAFIILLAMWLFRADTGTQVLGNAIFYILISSSITLVLTKLIHQTETEMTVSDAFKRIDQIGNIPCNATSGRKDVTDAAVELQKVSYTYMGREKKAVEKIDLKVEPGKTIALVGPSGGGKSTIANIVVGFLDDYEGEVFIGGVNRKDIAKEALMDQIAFVSQDSKLVKASIFENVRMGKRNASKEEVLSALRSAQCDDIIEKFKEGIDTVIGADGVYLSGGQRQRITIARAILKNAPILIMDEATAFADPDNESKIHEAMKELAKNKTVILIAHRLSTVKDVDDIYVVENGKIVENGTFDELTSANGEFTAMYKEYQKSIDWKVKKA